MIPELSSAADVQSVLDDWVARGQIVGGVVLVSEAGHVTTCAVSGWADREARQPMQRDTVLRYASLTKLVVSVVALRLCEQGLLDLDAKITDWLPTFRPCLPDGTCPDILIRHLLSHTAGLSYGFEQPFNNPYVRAGVSDGLDCANISRDENLARLGSVPLFFPPGTAWGYSLATDVLGAAIETACQDSLGRIAKRLVLDPLGMIDSGFPGQVRRLVAPGYWSEKSGAQRLAGTRWCAIDDGRTRISENKARTGGLYECAGAGMIGTADGYMKLLHCLRAGGAPVLTQASTTRLVTGAIGGVPLTGRGPGWTFGLGPVVLSDPALANHSQGAGTWGWCGVHGGHYWVDPENDLAMVALTNTGATGAWGPFADQLVEVLYAQ